MKPSIAHSWILLALCIGWGQGCEKNVPPAPRDTKVEVKPTTTREVETHQIEISRPEAKIAGELVVADAVNPTPLAVIVAGSGPTDRDGNSVAGIKTDAYKMLATDLAKRGVSTFRYDKRGIGTSTTTVDESQVDLNTFVNDLVGVVRHFEGDSRFDSLHIIGHSEGGLLAILAAPSLDVESLTLLATAGRPLREVLEEQLAKQAPTLMPDVRRILDDLENDREPEAIPDALMGLFRPSVQPFLKSAISVDPAQKLKELKARVLVVQGARDLQVSLKDAERLVLFRTDAEFLTLPKASHVLKDDPATELPQESYTNPNMPLSEGLSDAVAKHITKP